ncbi:hypothetical protein [Bradyrhizobium elkanii]|uniref:hypothetical protein n=1 Tax=Bradyrhizobium elkanii TaxID=29448 RepID=UPI0004B0C2D0|nr:hypothetical protein [Bradyrhizobium elkanii]
MKATKKDLQALRLLRVFSEITDPQAREAIIAFAEQQARETERGQTGHPPDRGNPE